MHGVKWIVREGAGKKDSSKQLYGYSSISGLVSCSDWPARIPNPRVGSKRADVEARETRACRIAFSLKSVWFPRSPPPPSTRRLGAQRS
jgi:hypothetical protein